MFLGTAIAIDTSYQKETLPLQAPEELEEPEAPAGNKPNTFASFHKSSIGTSDLGFIFLVHQASQR